MFIVNAFQIFRDVIGENFTLPTILIVILFITCNKKCSVINQFLENTQVFIYGMLYKMWDIGII